MKATQLLHNLDQSLWLDNITRDLLNSGTLKRYVDELSVTGLTSNPTISERCPRQREITDIMSADGGDCDTVLDQFATAGIDVYVSWPQSCRTKRPIVRQFVERTDGCDRLKDLQARESELMGC
jgi:hypothetical protein